MDEEASGAEGGTWTRGWRRRRRRWQWRRRGWGRRRRWRSGRRRRWVGRWNWRRRGQRWLGRRRGRRGRGGGSGGGGEGGGDTGRGGGLGCGANGGDRGGGGGEGEGGGPCGSGWVGGGDDGGEEGGGEGGGCGGVLGDGGSGLGGGGDGGDGGGSTKSVVVSTGGVIDSTGISMVAPKVSAFREESVALTLDDREASDVRIVEVTVTLAETTSSAMFSSGIDTREASLVLYVALSNVSTVPAMVAEKDTAATYAPPGTAGGGGGGSEVDAELESCSITTANTPHDTKATREKNRHNAPDVPSSDRVLVVVLGAGVVGPSSADMLLYRSGPVGVNRTTVLPSIFSPSLLSRRCII